MAGAALLPQAVLFVCNYNAVRSPMAHGLMLRRFGRAVFVESCGARAAGALDPFMVAVLDEIGVDLSRHRAKVFADLDDLNFDLVVTLTPEAHHKALEFTRTQALEVEYWPTYDPSLVDGAREQRLEAYRACRDTLDRKIAGRFAKPGAG